MSFLTLSPLSLNLLLNRNNNRPSLSFHVSRTCTSPPYLRHKFTFSKLRTVCSALQTNDGVSSDLCSTEPRGFVSDVRIVAVVGEGAVSPLKSASWLDVMSHTAERLKWIDDTYEMLVFTDNISESNHNVQNLQKETMELAETISEAWIRNNSDDIRKALQCLNQCSPVDQVCNYKCIASYESPILEEFSLCVLQKHNCLDLDAKIPEKPSVSPMVNFRDKVLSHEIAEDLFVGWLGNLEWSWRVVAGQNPAYDQFPCQYQLFYRGKARGSFWYEPVFQVKTLDGELVWRRRKYRVKRGKVAGTFYFSVLDNGVVSNEYWTIVDVCEDFSWALFHYSGAARVAGQSYTGAVLVSQDGEYPNEMEKDRLVSALDRCGIKEWELFDVDNCSCKDAPLGLPEGSRLHMTVMPDDCK
ncbi:hypothetical protein M8C21_012112 [Ambrosia artemisiifolia]|uniref:VDE lipocalin domain-containing protein n=1 Tax=Ambrosia artemisiifolia TaxID=4212 RepID=A0AAD5CVW0_AMBAR|nr:hypothetical protein M8C21_012112 [Ambrosia artemisiifolia]